MIAVAERGYLLVRSDGVLWGVSNGDVRRLTRQGLRYHLEVGGVQLGVDEVVGVVPELVVWPVSSALRRFWPEMAGGLAVHAAAPLVIIDPRRLPRALCIEGIEGEIADGEGRH